MTTAAITTSMTTKRATWTTLATRLSHLAGWRWYGAIVLRSSALNLRQGIEVVQCEDRPVPVGGVRASHREPDLEHVGAVLGGCKRAGAHVERVAPVDVFFLFGVRRRRQFI